MAHEKKREKVLITVKTYPTLSGKYDELVCTAGFREDGSWVRIYPIPFRKKSYEDVRKKYFADFAKTEDLNRYPLSRRESIVWLNVV